MLFIINAIIKLKYNTICYIDLSDTQITFLAMEKSYLSTKYDSFCTHIPSSNHCCKGIQYPLIVVYGSKGKNPNDCIIEASIMVFCIDCEKSKRLKINRLEIFGESIIVNNKYKIDFSDLNKKRGYTSIKMNNILHCIEHILVPRDGFVFYEGFDKINDFVTSEYYNDLSKKLII